MRRGWWAVLLVGIAMVPVVILLLFDRGDPETADVTVPTNPVIVGSIAVRTIRPHKGAPLVMDVSLGSDRPIAIDGLVIELQDVSSSARVYLRPDGATPQRIATRQTVVVMTGTPPAAGTYSYFLGYHTLASTSSVAKWNYLSPYGTVNVR